MGSLIPVDDGPVARCKLCGKTAVGPCARCRSPVCGDCCELTEGGATTFAVCLTCVKRGGKSLTGGWLGLVAWLGAIIVGLAAIVAVLVLAGCDGGKLTTSGGSGSSSRLAIADGYAYWFHPFIGLSRAPVASPIDRVALTRALPSDGNLRVTASHVYFRADDVVLRVPIGGGDATVVGPTIAGVPFQLAVDETAVYYARGATIVKHTLADDTETTLLEGRTTTSLALDGDTLVGTTCADAVDAIWRIPLAGTQPTRVVDRGCPEVAMLDASFIYVFDLVDGRPAILRVPRLGGTPVRLLETASPMFAVRDGFLYALDLSDAIVRVSVGGGQPAVLATPGRIVALGVDDTQVLYVTENDFGETVLNSLPLP
jgi:hypothetical protein